MSPLPDLSNEQKLTYIYHTLKDQEWRRKRALWYRFFKWIIVLGVVYLIVTYPKEITTKISELVKPLIMEQVDKVMQTQKNTLIKNIKDILPENVEVAPTPASVTPAVQKPTTTPKKSPAKPI